MLFNNLEKKEVMDMSLNQSFLAAIKDQRIDVIKSLIENGEVVDSPEFILSASESGDIEIVKLLLEAGADIEVRDDFGCNALLCSVSQQDIKMSEFLIEKGANINSAGTSGTTALMIAVRLGNLELVKLLVKKGAALLVRDLDKRDVVRLSLTVDNLNPEIVKFLLDEVWRRVQNATP